jgi:glycosyltransferase involved in cell wall biosynthesis
VAAIACRVDRVFRADYWRGFTVKILMLAPQPFFEPRGTPFSVLGRLKALSQLGHQVDLLTYHIGQDIVIPEVVIHRTPSIGFIKSIRIGPSIPKLFLDILMLTKAFSMLRKGYYDLVHAHEEASFFGVVLAKLFRIRHLYDMHSSLPQQLRNFQYTRFQPLINLFEWFERRVIESSDAIITICPALDEHVKKITEKVPHVMIENVAMEGFVFPSEEDVQEIKAAHSLEEKKIVLYTGTFEPYQGIDLLIASAQWVLRQRKDVVFLMVGGKPDQVLHYQNLVKEFGLSPYFCFTGTRQVDEMPLFVAAADILVSPRIHGTNTPLKIYSYLMSGKPIVATDITSHTQVLNSEIALLANPSPEPFASGILQLLEDQDLANRISLRARDVARERYNSEVFVEKTKWVLEQLASTA